MLEHEDQHIRIYTFTAQNVLKILHNVTTSYVKHYRNVMQYFNYKRRLPPREWQFRSRDRTEQKQWGKESQPLLTTPANRFGLSITLFACRELLLYTIGLDTEINIVPMVL